MYGQHLPPGGFLHPCSHLAPALLQALTLGEGGGCSAPWEGSRCGGEGLGQDNPPCEPQSGL